MDNTSWFSSDTISVGGDRNPLPQKNLMIKLTPMGLRNETQYVALYIPEMLGFTIRNQRYERL